MKNVLSQIKAARESIAVSVSVGREGREGREEPPHIPSALPLEAETCTSSSLDEQAHAQALSDVALVDWNLEYPILSIRDIFSYRVHR